MAEVRFKFNPTELNSALKRLAVVSNKTPAELVNQKGYRIFQKAVWWMKAVEKETIEKELGAAAATQLVRTKSGRFSRAKKNVRTFFGQGAGNQENFPLAAAIIQSRSGRNCKSSPWKGVDRATGAQRMLDAMRKLYGARLKSRAYFKATFATIRDVFRNSTKKSLPFSDPNSRGSGTKQSLARDKGRIADAKPAASRGSFAKADFWLVSPKHDKKDALDKYAAPVLQKAFDAEAGDTWKRAVEEEYKQAIKALGIKVS